MLRSPVLLCIAGFLIPFYPNAQTLSFDAAWQSNEPYLHGGRDDGAGFALNGIIYYGSGLDNGFEIRSEWASFSADEGWREVAVLSGERRQYLSAFASESYGYAMGGIVEGGFTNVCHRYNPEENQWNQLETPPWSPRAVMTVFTTPEAAYLIGGRNDSVRFSEVWRFEFKTEHWSLVGNTPFEGRDEMIAFADGFVGYLMLGRSDKGVHEDVWSMNTLSGEWIQHEDFPGEARTYSSAVSVPGGAVITGGQSKAGEFLAETWFYNLQQDQWSALSSFNLFGARRGHASFYTNHQVFIVGGLSPPFYRPDETLALKSFPSHVHTPLRTRLYPNPSSNSAYLEIHKSFNRAVEVYLYDLSGSKLWEAKEYGSLVSIPTRRWLNGVYVLIVKADELITYRKLVIRRP